MLNHQTLSGRNFYSYDNTLFSTWTKEVKLNIDIQKLWDLHKMDYSTHAAAVVNKLWSRNKVVKALADSIWDMDKGTMLATCKSIGCSLVIYAAPSLSDTQWRNAQSLSKWKLKNRNGLFAIFLTTPSIWGNEDLISQGTQDNAK